MTFASAHDVAEIIDAASSLAWPAVAVLVILLFREQINVLFQRLRRGKAGPVEFELDEALGRLERQAENAAQSVGDSSVSPPEVEETESIEDLVFDEAKTSPKVALMSLAARIERESQEILASSQEPATWERRTLFDKVKRLDVSPFVKSAALQFQHVRNRIVHDPDATDEDALRAIDAGLTILEALQKVPHEIHFVRDPQVELYADEQGTRPVRDYHGVVLASVNSDGTTIVHAFPSTRTHFRKGEPVAWEWGNRRFPEAWYRDRADNTIKYGWTASLEFVGRHLADL